MSPPADAQRVGSEFENLEVLPPDISRIDLIRTMRGFTQGLGVRCEHCHVVTSRTPSRTFDFAADDKETKLKARMMMQMVANINLQFLAELPGRESGDLSVRCETCHRGQARPVFTRDSLRTAYAAGGFDAFEQVYRQLRTRYFGSQTHDFTPGMLSNLGAELMARGQAEDALAVHELNYEFHPDNGSVVTAYAVALIEVAMHESLDAGLAQYREILERYSADVLADNSVNSLGYRLMGSGKLDEAIEVFKINVELHPESSNAYDSLGEGYMNAEETELAIRNYERSLELNPNNTNAVNMLERLRSN